MPVDPRTGEPTDSVPAMDKHGNIRTRQEMKSLHKALKPIIEGLPDAATVHPPVPGSALATLDADGFTREPLSVIVMNALMSAGAHLDAARGFYKSRQANRITGSSLLRPALMAATTAGWPLVATSKEEMLRRAATLAHEAHRYELQFLNSVEGIEGAEVEERRTYVEGREADLTAWAEQNGGKLPPKMNMTTAIREVATALEADTPRLLADWSEMSSGAHGLGWHVQTRTFGQGTQDLPDSDKVRFPIALDRPTYLAALERITHYTFDVGKRAALFQTPITDLVALTVPEDVEN